MGNKLTITLTDRAPVTVDTDKWQLIASSKDYEGQYDFQSFRHWKLFVRQCFEEGDDRCIVYGVYSTAYQNERNRRGGLIVENIEAVPSAIKQVCEYLGFEQSLADACIADLPAVDL